MPDRNQQNERDSSNENLNSKEPNEIDRAPEQDIEKVSIESQKGKKVDADPTQESDKPLQQ